MTDVIVIAGAPGSGKSTIAAALREELDGPLFEFGWIPEFRRTRTGSLTYPEEAAFAFENLVLVVKNYIRHGFTDVIVTDLSTDAITQLSSVFSDHTYLLVTLRVRDPEVLRRRVLEESRSSAYRDWQAALRINAHLWERDPLEHEVFLDLDEESPADVVAVVRRLLQP